jgi:hypothetical protein
VQPTGVTAVSSAFAGGASWSPVADLFSLDHEAVSRFMSHKNGKPFTQKEQKVLARIILRHDAEIDKLWGIIQELKLELISAGVKVADAQKWQAAHVSCQKHGGLAEVQRQRLWNDLGLDEDDVA